jgi:hypothetical protein
MDFASPRYSLHPLTQITLRNRVTRHVFWSEVIYQSDAPKWNRIVCSVCWQFERKIVRVEKYYIWFSAPFILHSTLIFESRRTSGSTYDWCPTPLENYTSIFTHEEGIFPRNVLKKSITNLFESSVSRPPSFKQILLTVERNTLKSTNVFSEKKLIFSSVCKLFAKLTINSAKPVCISVRML